MREHRIIIMRADSKKNSFFQSPSTFLCLFGVASLTGLLQCEE